MTTRIEQTFGAKIYSNIGVIVAELRSLRTASRKSRYHEGPLPECALRH